MKRGKSKKKTRKKRGRKTIFPLFIRMRRLPWSRNG
jgi:hypothetical protein